MSGSGRHGLSTGFHAVSSLLDSAPGSVSVLYVDRRRRGGRIADLVRRADAAGIAVHGVDRETLDRMCGELRHQGIVAKRSGGRGRTTADVDEVLDGTTGVPRVLVLDGVQDPHNLGACLRSAEGAGVDLVVVPKDRSCRLTPVAERASAGASERVPLATVTNLARTLDRLKARGLWIVGGAGDGDTEIYSTALGGPLALVVGAEGGGMRRLTRERCDLVARIPLAGAMASLNVSVAAGVLLFEAVRQRRGSGG
jgi:23S rRNA (guanosine2251-2'-O)-methyltransferase